MRSELVTYCAELFDLDPKDLIGRKRKRSVTRARFALYAALRQRGWSYPAIGKFIGRDHATIIHGVRKADYLMEHDRSYEEKIEALAMWKPKPVVLPVEESDQ